MKHLITLFLVIFTLNSFAQEKELTHLRSNLFQFVERVDGEIKQSGLYKKIGNKYIQHGKWVDNLGNTHKYKNGRLLWMEFGDHSRHKVKRLEFYLDDFRFVDLTEKEMESKLKD